MVSGSGKPSDAGVPIICSVGLCVAVLASLLLAAPVASGSGSVYVTDAGGDAVSQYSVGAGGVLSALVPPTVPAGAAPIGMAISPDGRSAYVSDFNDSSIWQYDIDPQSGALTSKTPPTVAKGEPAGFATGIAVTPDGRSAYASNGADDTVSQYDIDPQGGALTPKTPATVATGPGPVGVAVNPDGRSAYVSNQAGFVGGGSISQYDIDPVSGVLTPKAVPTVNTELGPSAVAVTTDGSSAYVANQFGNGGVAGNSVSQYDVDRRSGALTPKTPAKIVGPIRPVSVVVSPDGTSAYTANLGDGSVSQFDIGSRTGALTPKTPATVDAGDTPLAMAVTPDGESAYVTDRPGFLLSGSVFQYRIDPQTGALTPSTPATVAAGIGPYGIAVSPLPGPTSVEQCKHGGWRNFPQFKSQGECIAFVNHGP